MIYFLLHNNVHLLDAEEHLKNLDGYEVSLIKIPHKLTLEPTYPFKNEYEYPILLRKKIDYLNVARIKAIHHKIQQDFKNVGPGDVLIFYTEFETLSHYVISLFKQKKAMIILMDEGFATYGALMKSASRLKTFDKLRSFYLKYILQYANTIIAVINDYVYLRLTDNMIDYVLLYNQVQISRNLKPLFLKSSTHIYDKPDHQKIIFLNEPLYDYYLGLNDYLNILKDILSKLVDEFEVVYFKFHPREREINKQKILMLIEKLSNKIIVMTDNRPVELLINDLHVKYIASFFAQTLLNHSHSNCICLYLFHKYPALAEHPVLAPIKKILYSLNYKFMNNWANIRQDKIGFPLPSNDLQPTLKGHLDVLLNLNETVGADAL